MQAPEVAFVVPIFFACLSSKVKILEKKSISGLVSSTLRKCLHFFTAELLLPLWPRPLWFVSKCGLSDVKYGLVWVIPALCLAGVVPSKWSSPTGSIPSLSALCLLPRSVLERTWGCPVPHLALEGWEDVLGPIWVLPDLAAPSHSGRGKRVTLEQ